MVQKQGIGYDKWFIFLVGSHEHSGDGFFYHDKREFRICNGKKCKRIIFLTMRKIFLWIFRVKLCQGRRAETCEPFFVALWMFSKHCAGFVLCTAPTSRRCRSVVGTFAWITTAWEQVSAVCPMLTLPARKKGRSLYATPLGFLQIINLRTASCTEWCRLRCT